MKPRKDSVSLDDLNPLDLEGTAEDIAFVERWLTVTARKTLVWASVVDGWKKNAALAAAAPNKALPAVPAESRVVPLRNESQVIGETVAGLAQRYRTHERSPYRKLRYKTRVNYDNMIKRLLKDCGDDTLADLKTENIRLLYDRWSTTGQSSAHSLITMMRGLINFGADVLGDRECDRLSSVLHRMRFKAVRRSRSEGLTADQANAIRAMAHKMGRPSIALAQAFQFDCALTQKDVIGEWVPETEPGPLNVLHEGKKWLGGLRWEEISHLMLRHTPSNGGETIEIDLRQKEMVIEELRLLGELPRSGPVVVCEFSEFPWTSYEFRRWWRKVADACRIPKNVKNMDSRAGADERERPKARSNDPLLEQTVRTTPSEARH